MARFCPACRLNRAQWQWHVGELRSSKLRATAPISARPAMKTECGEKPMKIDSPLLASPQRRRGRCLASLIRCGASIRSGHEYGCEFRTARCEIRS